MSTNEFDELLKGKFDQNDFAYNAEHWDRLSRQLSVLEKRKPAITVLWWKVASVAATVALVTTITAYIYKTNVAPKHSNIAQTHINVPANAPVDQQNMQQPAMQEPADNVAAIQKNTGSKSGFRNVKRSNTNNGFNSQVTKQYNSNTVITQNNTVAVQAIPPVNAAPVNKQNPVNNISAISPAIQPKSSQEQHNINIAYNLDFTSGDNGKEEKYAELKKVIISVAGGVHYVSSSPGYMVGANARKRLSDKFYLEADVAFLSNNNTQTTTTTTTIPAENNSNPISSNLQTGFASGTPGTSVPSAFKTSGPSQPSTPSQSGTNFNTSTSKHTPTATTKVTSKKNLYNFNYLQVAPQAGYNISHRLSVGVGADVEQLLQNNQSSADIASGQVKAAPDMNVGMIGKTEYSLTNRLKAGVLYRGDVNGLFSKSDKYVNQSFIQFQLKLAIFNK
ncbi:MAG TPA: hypothetical protein VN721_00060 [Flavipsychrobacter sp.]|nr:hypothetical protein [Flavipsychrobacter sp.]